MREYTITPYNIPKKSLVIDGVYYVYKKQSRYKKGDYFITIYKEGDKKQDPVFQIDEQTLDVLSRLDEEDIIYFAMKNKKSFIVVDFPSYVKFFRPEMYQKYKLLFS